MRVGDIEIKHWFALHIAFKLMGFTVQFKDGVGRTGRGKYGRILGWWAILLRRALWLEGLPAGCSMHPTGAPALAHGELDRVGLLY